MHIIENMCCAWSRKKIPLTEVHISACRGGKKLGLEVSQNYSLGRSLAIAGVGPQGLAAEYNASSAAEGARGQLLPGEQRPTPQFSRCGCTCFNSVRLHCLVAEFAGPVCFLSKSNLLFS